VTGHFAQVVLLLSIIVSGARAVARVVALVIVLMVAGPSFAERDELASLLRQIDELALAGKRAQATPLIERMVALTDRHGRSRPGGV
jgi:hypothetical protein